MAPDRSPVTDAIVRSESPLLIRHPWSITLPTPVTRSRPDGTFTLRGVNPWTDVDVVARSRSRGSETRRRIGREATKPCRLQFPVDRTFDLTVVDHDGDPVTNASIRCSSALGWFFAEGFFRDVPRRWTDDAGEGSAGPLGPAVWEISVRAPGTSRVGFGDRCARATHGRRCASRRASPGSHAARCRCSSRRDARARREGRVESGRGSGSRTSHVALRLHARGAHRAGRFVSRSTAWCPARTRCSSSRSETDAVTQRSRAFTPMTNPRPCSSPTSRGTTSRSRTRPRTCPRFGRASWTGAAVPCHPGTWRSVDRSSNSMCTPSRAAGWTSPSQREDRSSRSGRRSRTTTCRFRSLRPPSRFPPTPTRGTRSDCHRESRSRESFGTRTATPSHTSAYRCG